jgi:hypothetical protein
VFGNKVLKVGKMKLISLISLGYCRRRNFVMYTDLLVLLLQCDGLGMWIDGVTRDAHRIVVEYLGKRPLEEQEEMGG